MNYPYGDSQAQMPAWPTSPWPVQVVGGQEQIDYVDVVSHTPTLESHPASMSPALYHDGMYYYPGSSEPAPYAQ